MQCRWSKTQTAATAYGDSGYLWQQKIVATGSAKSFDN